jgi:hypothetical protein
MFLPKPIPDDTPGVYGPVMDLTEHGPFDPAVCSTLVSFTVRTSLVA